MYTLRDYLTSSGKFPDRERSPDCTGEVIINATKLIACVNAFMVDLGVTELHPISSGFRTAAVNYVTAGAAKKSGHMLGMAVDLQDDLQQSLGFKIKARPDLLRKHGLMLEDLDSTPTWCHLDIVSRKDRPSRIFKP